MLTMLLISPVVGNDIRASVDALSIRASVDALSRDGTDIRASVDALSRDGTDMRGDAQNPKSFQAPRM